MGSRERFSADLTVRIRRPRAAQFSLRSITNDPFQRLATECRRLPVRLTTTIPSAALGLLTWAALRGGLAVALALSIPPSPQRELILPMTYGVVVFSLLVQGLTLKPIVARLDSSES